MKTCLYHKISLLSQNRENPKNVKKDILFEYYLILFIIYYLFIITV